MYYWISEEEFDRLSEVLACRPGGQIRVVTNPSELDGPAQPGTEAIDTTREPCISQETCEQVATRLSLEAVSAAIAVHPREAASWLYRVTDDDSGRSEPAVALSSIRKIHALDANSQITLAEVRSACGLTIDAASELSDFSAESMRKIEAGKLRPRPDKLHRLAHAYRLPIDVIAAAWATTRQHALSGDRTRRRRRRRL
jgi:hypothetical protein